MQNWIEGGPFLEISFIIESKLTRVELIDNTLIKLKGLFTKIEICENNLKRKIQDFSNGYKFDEHDKGSPIIHSICINIFINIAGKRKSILFLEEISSNTYQVNFCFYGSEYDEPEWGQIGIKDKDMSTFRDFFISLFRIFNFAVGAISFENDSICLFFKENVFWPNKVFKVSNINFLEKIIFNPEHYYVIDLIFNINYFSNIKLPKIYKRIENNGILICA